MNCNGNSSASASPLQPLLEVWHDGKGSRRATRWFVGDVICVVLNVDADSENANSSARGGVGQAEARACSPFGEVYGVSDAKH